MGRTLRVLLGAAALCLMLMPSVVNAQESTQRDCCDIADEISQLQGHFDELDDRLDELDAAIQLGQTFQQQILMRVPFTEEDQQAWLDISRVILSASEEKDQLQLQQDDVALRIIELNQDLSTCVPIQDDGGPITPMPDPFPMMP